MKTNREKKTATGDTVAAGQSAPGGARTSGPILLHLTGSVNPSSACYLGVM